MAVTLQSTPTTNTCAVQIAFLNAGAMVASLPPGGAQTLTITFDQIGLFNPPHPPVIRTQNPVAALAVPVGDIAYVSTSGGATLLKHAPPNGVEQTIRFT